MKLSMSMLAWYLRDFRPESHIHNDSVCIQGLRFVLDDVDELLPEYLYFGAGRFFITAPQYAGAVLVVNQHSMLIFKDVDYNGLLNALLSAFDFFNRWEAKLLEAESRHAPLRDFLNIAAPVFGNPMSVGNLDLSFVVISDLTGHKADPLWENMPSIITSVNPSMYEPFFGTGGERIGDLSERPQLVRNVYSGGDPVMMLYLCLKDEVVGSLGILQEDRSLTELDFQLAPIFARHCLYARELVSGTGAVQSGASVFRNLLEGQDVGQLNLDLLPKLLPPPPWRLLALRVSGRTDRLAIHTLLSDLRLQRGYYLPVETQGVCLCMAAEAELQSVEPLAGAASIGASIPFSELNALPVRRQQAEFALGQSNNAPGLFLCENYACDYLLRSFRAMELTGTLLHPALETLERYDRETQSELRETLSVYLQQERNQLLSAKVLHIHPNTMRYRLGRIMELTGLTLTDPEELKYLRLSDWLEG